LSVVAQKAWPRGAGCRDQGEAGLNTAVAAFSRSACWRKLPEAAADSSTRAASALRCDSVRTSAATTAKPRPCSPARAASTAALSARMLVWTAMLSMPPVMSAMRRLAYTSSRSADCVSAKHWIICDSSSRPSARRVWHRSPPASRASASSSSSGSMSFSVWRWCCSAACQRGR
jgi:hypothetical protein